MNIGIVMKHFVRIWKRAQTIDMFAFEILTIMNRFGLKNISQKGSLRIYDKSLEQDDLSKNTLMMKIIESINNQEPFLLF